MQISTPLAFYPRVTVYLYNFFFLVLLYIHKIDVLEIVLIRIGVSHDAAWMFQERRMAISL